MRCCVLDPQRIHQWSVFAIQMQSLRRKFLLTRHAKTTWEVLMVFSQWQIRMWESLHYPRHIVKAAAYLAAHALTCTWQAIPVQIQHLQMAATITTKCNTLSVPNLIVSTTHTMTTRESTPQVLSMTRAYLWNVLIESSATRCCVLDPQRIHQWSVFAIQMQSPRRKFLLTRHAKTTWEVLMVFSQWQIRMWESPHYPRHIVKAAAYLAGHALTCTWQAIPVQIQHRQMAATITTKCNTLSVPNLIVSTTHTMTTRESTPQVLSMTRAYLWHVLIESSAMKCCVLDPQRIHQWSVFAVQMQSLFEFTCRAWFENCHGCGFFLFSLIFLVESRC